MIICRFSKTRVMFLGGWLGLGVSSKPAATHCVPSWHIWDLLIVSGTFAAFIACVDWGFIVEGLYLFPKATNTLLVQKTRRDIFMVWKKGSRAQPGWFGYRVCIAQGIAGGFLSFRKAQYPFCSQTSDWCALVLDCNCECVSWWIRPHLLHHSHSSLRVFVVGKP